MTPPFLTPRGQDAGLDPILVVSADAARLEHLVTAVSRRARARAARDIDAAVELARLEQVSAVVGDAALRHDPVVAVRDLRRLARARPLLVCSRVDDPRIPNEAIHVLARYAFGDDVDEKVELFVERVALAARGMDAWVAAAVLWLGREWKIGPREREVLGLVAQFASIEDIATTLGITASTVNKHLASLRAHARVSSKEDLARRVRAHARERFGRA